MGFGAMGEKMLWRGWQTRERERYMSATTSITVIFGLPTILLFKSVHSDLLLSQLLQTLFLPQHPNARRNCC